MAVGAVLVMFVAVLVGVLLLAEVANVPGLGWSKGLHVLLAVGAIVVVSAAAFTASGTVAWAAAAVLLATGSAGVLTWRRSLRARGADTRPVPPALLVVHGAAAVLAFILVVLAAAH